MSIGAPRQKGVSIERSVIKPPRAVGVSTTSHLSDVPVELKDWELCLGVKVLPSSVLHTSLERTK